MSEQALSETIDASSKYEDSLPISSGEMLAMLDDKGIGYELHTHPPLRTVEDSQSLRGQIEGAHIKNLYLRDGKKRNYLVVAAEDKAIDLKQLGVDIGAGRLSFGSADRLMQFLGVRPGAVSPLTLANDQDNNVTLVLDRNLLTAEKINVHPLVNDKTITLKMTDLLQYLEGTGHSEHKILI